MSQEVLEELSSPRYPQRADALEWIAPLNVLQITPGVRELASTLVRERVMPGPVTGDAVHIATAVVYEMEYVLSWNVRHLANPNKLVHLQTVCARHAFTAPRIVTPDHVWENP
ncbi:MAG: hypothetical protein ACREIT_00655 [Tepidisphaeraceae bacterium]